MYREEPVCLSVCLLREIRIIAQLNWKGTQAQHLHFINGETEAQKGGMTCPKVNSDSRAQLKPEYGSAHSQSNFFCFLPSYWCPPVPGISKPDPGALSPPHHGLLSYSDRKFARDLHGTSKAAA